MGFSTSRCDGRHSVTTSSAFVRETGERRAISRVPTRRRRAPFRWVEQGRVVSVATVMVSPKTFGTDVVPLSASWHGDRAGRCRSRDWVTILTGAHGMLGQRGGVTHVWSAVRFYERDAASVVR